MSFRIFCVFLFLLFSISNSQSCLLPTQLPGKCSSCLSTQLLQNANCYEKLRGCLDQLQSICTKCQNGYVLSNSACIKQAEYFNLTSLSPPPSTIIDSPLNMSAIQPIVVGGYVKTTNFDSQFYLAAINKLYLDYPYLKTLSIVNVEEQVVSGMNFLIYIVDSNSGDSYSAVIYVNLSKAATVKSVYKNENQVTLGLNATNTQNQSGSIPGGWDLFTNYTDQRYLDSKSALFSSYTLLENYDITKVQYQVVAGVNFLFYLKSKNDSSTFVAEVFNPLYANVKILNTWENSTNSSNTLAGGYQIFTGDLTSDSNYLSAYNAVINSYPQLKNYKVTRVQQQIVAGTNYIIDFVSANSTDVFTVKVYVPLAFTQQPPLIGYVLKNGQNYTSNGSQNVSLTQASNQTNPQVGNYQNLDANYSSNTNYLSALSTLKNTYPVLKNAVVVKVQEQIVAGVNYIINFKQINSTNTYQGKVFIPLPFTKIPPQIKYFWKNGQDYTNPSTNQVTNTTLTSSNSTDSRNSSSNSQAGGYQVVTDFSSDQNYLSALSAAKTSYPILNNCTVAKVQQQVVAGINYIIHFNQINSRNTYEVKVFVPLAFTQQPPRIDYILKNGQSYLGGNSLTTSSIGQVYNWQTDSVFSNLYNYFKAQAEIVNLTPVVQVLRTNKSNQGIRYFEYKIIYSTYQYAIVRYYPQINKFKVVSYIADGTEIYQLTKPTTPLAEQSQYSLQSVISSSNSTYFGNVLIQSVQYIPLQPSFSVYVVNATILDGTYKIKLLDDGSTSLYNIIKVSNSTCFQINATYTTRATHQQYVRDQLVTYLKSKYNFTDYENTLSVVKFSSNNTIDYRILFSRKDLKQVIVKIQGVSDKYTIKELSLLYQGLGVVNSSSAQSVNVTNLARNSIYSSVLKTANLIGVKFNGQKYELTFADSNRLYNYTYLNSSLSVTLQSTIFSGSIACQNTTNTACKSCGENSILWFQKCYAKLQNCNVQAGNICVVCSSKSILIEGKCVSNCQKMFS